MRYANTRAEMIKSPISAICILPPLRGKSRYFSFSHAATNSAAAPNNKTKNPRFMRSVMAMLPVCETISKSKAKAAVEFCRS